MTKQKALAMIKKVEKMLEILCPSLRETISFCVIDDHNGTHGSSSYCKPLKTYKASWIYINLQNIECFDDALDSISHELCHALAIHYEHYIDVVNSLLPKNSIDAMNVLGHQTAESFVMIAQPFVLFWLKSFLTEKAKH